MDIIAAILVIALVIALAWWVTDYGDYKPGHNPAARQCEDCGQIQHMYCNSLDSWDHTYWVAVGETRDFTCKCHKDTL